MQKYVKDFSDVPPIVPGQRVFTPDQFRLLLGGISKELYYKLRRGGLIKFSRLERGSQAVHTLEQYEEYLEYLNHKGEVNGNRNSNGNARQRGGDAEQ